MIDAELVSLLPRDLLQRELAPVEIAVVDTGIDGSHPELRGRVRAAFQIVRSRSRLRVEAGDPARNNDRLGHGTAVASVITSIAPNARLVDLEIAGADMVGSGDALLAGLRHAIDLGCAVINLSLACHRRLREPLANLCELAYFRNQLVVASRRNTPLGDDGLPAELSSCIGVDRGSVATPFELRFRERQPIEFASLGSAVKTAVPGGGYALQQGTSFATPVVSGLAALYLGARPSLTPYELKTLLKRVAEAPPAR